MPATLEQHITGTPSIGGATTATVLPTAEMDNLWDDVTGAESAAGDIEYRALDLTNTGGAPATGVTYWLDALEALGDDDTYAAYNGNTIRLGLESSPLDSETAVADENTAPAGVTFAAADGQNNALDLPDIPVGSYARVWFERTVPAGSSNQRAIRSTMHWEYA